MKKSRHGVRDRLVKAGLIAAAVLTLTWWTLLAAGLWQAIEWVAA